MEIDWSVPITAQEDWYNGIKFRSKLESKTAQALDNIGIPYQYEPDGYKLSNGMWYRPDFWLPDAQQFIECKGVMDMKDCAKIVGLVNDTGKPVLVMSYDNAMLFQWYWMNPGSEIATYTDSVKLAKCDVCDTLWFASSEDSYACPKCGAHDGMHLIKFMGDVCSGQQLFNFGQEAAADKPIYKQIAEKFNG